MTNTNYGKPTNSKLDVYNMLALIGVGVVIKMILGHNFTNDGSSGPASSTIWGYGLSTVALFSLAFISLALAKRGNEDSIIDPNKQGVLDFLATFSSNFLPSLLFLIVFIWIISLNIIYFKRINQDKVASEFFQYSTLSSFLILFQLGLLFQHYKKLFANTNQKTHWIADNTMSLNYILTLLNLILTGMMQIVLEFYSTDG